MFRKAMGRLRATSPGSVSIWCCTRSVRPGRGENTAAKSACNRARSVSCRGERWSPPRRPERTDGFWVLLLVRDHPRSKRPRLTPPTSPRSSVLVGWGGTSDMNHPYPFVWLRNRAPLLAVWPQRALANYASNFELGFKVQGSLLFVTYTIIQV